jgi:HPt (histidine-containing phosphotransfer) domain-containing protein
MPRVEVDKELEEIVPNFLRNRERDILVLEQAIAGGDFTTVASIGHRIRGSSGGYGFDDLGEIGKSLEEAGNAGDAPGARQAFSSMKSYLTGIQVIYV